jgi:hypothetical protein
MLGAVMTERIRPETIALTLIQHARDSEREPETYLARVVAELLEAEPVVRQPVSDYFFVELVEALGGRGEAEAVRAVLEVQIHWDKEASR